jgi:hypothetical protein
MRKKSPLKSEKVSESKSQLSDEIWQDRESDDWILIDMTCGDDNFEFALTTLTKMSV